MIRQKKEFRCAECGNKFLKWQGICPTCGKGGTLKEYIIIPVKVKPVATRSQKSIQRRAKTSERNIGKRMLELEGQDPKFKNIATSTGRIGHITNLRADTVSLNHLIENKNRALPIWLINAWILILQRAADFEKHPILHLDPPNLPKEYPHNGVQKKTDTMAIIPQSRYEDLCMKEKELEELQWRVKNLEK